jgi:hypothetical protein
MMQANIEELKNDLYLLCKYAKDEPQYHKYNDAMLETIDKMTLKTVLFALEDVKALYK